MIFQELYDFIKSKPNQAVQTDYFFCPNIHFTADKELQNITQAIENGKDPRKDKRCKECKLILERIVEQLKQPK